MSEPRPALGSLPIFAGRDTTTGSEPPAVTPGLPQESPPARRRFATRTPGSASSSQDSNEPDPAGAHRRRIDWGLVRELRLEVARRRSGQLQDQGALGNQDDDELGRKIIRELVQDHVDAQLATAGVSVSSQDQQALERAVEDSVFGMGRLQPLVDNPDIENIEIFGADNVVLEYADGRLTRSEPVAESDADLVEDLNYLAANGSSGNAREFSTASPQLHMRLPGGSRLAASMSISPRPVVTIRRHRLRRVSLSDLVGRSMLSPDVAELLRAAVTAQKTIMIAGPQGGGKTTLLRACCAAMDPWENVGTIESEYELHLHELADQHQRIRAWESRPGTGEIAADGRRAGEVTLDELTESVWRHNLDRLILGEVRGREAAALMKVISGIQGAMWTVHAASARAAIERMVTLMMEAGPHITVEFARRQVAAHVDLIVQIGVKVIPGHTGSVTDQGNTPGRHRTRRRYVAEVLAVEEGEAGVAATSELFSVKDESLVAVPIHPLPPKLLRDLSAAGSYAGPDPIAFRTAS
ncbi:MAG: Flp pilus assembly complex ATPase component TadA [Actinomycetia bacterium]|nr:Flp pilus assembly complex ATPase component TadA [Actinomycetes bacterium]